MSKKNNENEREVFSYDEPGYKPLFYEDEYVVSCLNYLVAADMDNVKTLEKHKTAAEIFLPVEGTMALVKMNEKSSDSANISVQKMKVGSVYRVRKNIWHGLIMEQGAKCFIIKDKKSEKTNDVDKTGLKKEKIKIIRNKYRELV